MKTYWTMEGGGRIKIKEMTTSHIENTLKMLERQQENIDESLAASSLRGEMAQYYAERDALHNERLGCGHSCYRPLLNELERRKK